jgi:polysaccharide export outer membrane protein
MDMEPTGKIFLLRFFIGIVGTYLFLFTYACSNPVAHIPEFGRTKSTTATVQSSSSPESRYNLVPYDSIHIKFPYHPERDTPAPIPIRPDGQITLDVGAVQAAGLTPEQLSKAIAQKYAERMKDPEVIVTVAQYAPRKIYVGGEVKTPGVVLIQEGTAITPMQAIFDRGGFTPTAQVDSVVLIRDGGSANPQIGRININQAMEGGVPEQVALLPNDVIYVPMSGIGRADLWVKQHIRDILPTELFGFGSLAR